MAHHKRHHGIYSPARSSRRRQSPALWFRDTPLFLCLEELPAVCMMCSGGGHPGQTGGEDMRIARLQGTPALRPRVVMLLTAVALCRAGLAAATPPAAKCEASKLLASGKSALCLFKGQANTVLGKTVDT